LAKTVEKELAEHLIGDALENVVSAFDGFGVKSAYAKARRFASRTSLEHVEMFRKSSDSILPMA
jgi:hypothetical protein